MTHEPFASVPTPFTVGNGDVRIGGLTGVPSLLCSRLSLPGGTLTFDVRDLSAGAVIDDVRAAEPWLRATFGDRASAVALALDPNDHDVVDPDATFALRIPPSAVRDDFARLALGQWIRRYWPRAGDIPPLIDSLLCIELAALAWRHDVLLPGIQRNAGFLEGNLGALREAVRQAVDGATDSATREILVLATEAALYADLPHGSESDLLDELESLLPLLLEAPRPGGTYDGWLADHHASRRRTLRAATRADFALAAGEPTSGGSTGDIHGVDSIDWDLVPPRVVDWSENTIHWHASQTDAGWRVVIDAEAVPAPEYEAPLHARLYAPGAGILSALPLARCRLRLEGERYRGEAVIDDYPDGLVIEVYSETRVRRPMLGDAHRDSAARARAEARDFVYARAGRAYSSGGADRPFLGESLGT